ncbi:spore germination protein [Paenibacillus larvae subsp. pulvifaciens]|uniref:Spore germination protein n=1 Tax=Paenibacillus larvae subsp. pulvifaciens TaxID=1477 RepID=A0A1V0UNU0_9BACL|nr:spore germination protein [Paenibacillus larvae]ARF66628.1 spore germination protein [Paenibacillus larvae subsp. pulvifaciens]MCY9512458.1 spore germination protein [Paenibacillus larvae]MCY9527096.1 spore germination protein [Paenibacillus larvae]
MKKNRWLKQLLGKAQEVSSDTPICQGHPVDEQVLRFTFQHCADVQIQSYKMGEASTPQNVIIVFCEGLADVRQLNDLLLPRLRQMMDRPVTEESLSINPLIPIRKLEQPDLIKEVTDKVFSGEAILFFPEAGLLYSFDIAQPPHRQPSESNTEVSIRGSKDGFTEEVITNVGLIRKRMHTKSLSYESFTIGKRTKNKVALLYIEDVIQPFILQEVKRRINSVDIDMLISSSQLQELIVDRPKSLFPLLDYVGRPDYVVEALLRGRFAILVNGSPMAVLGPCNLFMTLKSPEDIHTSYYFVIFERTLRLLGLLGAIFIPGFWVALIAFDIDQIPFPMLATVANARVGVPLSSAMEMILMLGLFELFREAGSRLPKAVGQTVAVVGGLIVGDAAIRAGLGSPTTLVMAAITAVATFTLVNQSISGTVSLLRLFVLLISSCFGTYGFFLGVLYIVYYLSTLQSFGISYLAPLSPLNMSDLYSALFAKTQVSQDNRPEFLNTVDDTRTGERS